MRALIMAGGRGTRLRPLTEVIPKPLLPVGGRPILELILCQLKGYGFSGATISLGYKADLIRSYFGDGRRLGIPVDYVEEMEPLGTAGALGLLQQPVDGPLLTMNGDILTKLNMRRFVDQHVESGCAVTVAVRSDSYQVPFGVIESNGDHIQRIVEKPVHDFLVSAGIYVLEPHVVRSVSPGVRLDLPDL